jgi:hypothetical protein
VQERFAFVLTGLEARIPDSYPALFGSGSAPASWNERPPTLAEVKKLLGDQRDRIAGEIKGQIGNLNIQPYTTSSGFTLVTPASLLNFTLYHEGMHFQAMKLYKKLLGR